MVDFIANNWGWCLLGWIVASAALVPFIARFCGLNEKRRVEQQGPRVIDWDSDDWKDQTRENVPRIR